MATGHLRKRINNKGGVSYQITAEGERDPLTGKRERRYKTITGTYQVGPGAFPSKITNGGTQLLLAPPLWQINGKEIKWSGLKKIAIVGYTNAGKSTLLNRLTDAGILAEDKLFATLDPTTRKFELPSGETVLLTDTVGFIRKLPHHLVNAFRSTLDEAVCADIVMILTDASDPEWQAQLECTEQTLAELGAEDKPTLYVFNKCDKIEGELFVDRSPERRHTVCISAKTGMGCDELAEKLEEMVHEGKSRVTFRIPNTEQRALNVLYKDATVEDVEYGDEFVTVVATVDAKVRGMLRKYDTEADTKDDEEY